MTQTTVMFGKGLAFLGREGDAHDLVEMTAEDPTTGSGSGAIPEARRKTTEEREPLPPTPREVPTAPVAKVEDGRGSHIWVTCS